ncbi:hypothetical protein HO173_012467 [Letharia columbiana]|uniref:Uncharacterized protein n=1 Tax=Letharia columbiana TaxID=112416 RepID=A0A8H6CN92_9LECA|nr:uncharacterized protein HO173_012467 [Letharia columbiana]KAF6226637.1 hypothetical protein HO173_012467 [Letharia columbiana]
MASNTFDQSLARLDQMIAIIKSRMTPTELQALEAFDLLSFDDKMAQWEARSRPTQPATQPTQLAPQSPTQSVTQLATQPATQPATQSATQPEHSVEQEEESLQQANAENTAENTAEKASDNKATISKNTAQLSIIPRHILSTVPHQITTQQAENDTTIWPAISACLDNITLWYITAMSTQEKDLLRRSQPIGPLQARVTYRTMHIWTN